MGLNPNGIQASQILPEDDIISPRRGYARARDQHLTRRCQ